MSPGKRGGWERKAPEVNGAETSGVTRERLEKEVAMVHGKKKRKRGGGQGAGGPRKKERTGETGQGRRGGGTGISAPQG